MIIIQKDNKKVVYFPRFPSLLDMYCYMFGPSAYLSLPQAWTLDRKKQQVLVRGVTIQYPHDTIRIAILESRYDTYRDTW